MKPLAERMRPKTLADFSGQEHLVGLRLIPGGLVSVGLRLHQQGRAGQGRAGQVSSETTIRWILLLLTGWLDNIWGLVSDPHEFQMWSCQLKVSFGMIPEVTQFHKLRGGGGGVGSGSA